MKKAITKKRALDEAPENNAEGPYLSISMIPWNVIESCILPYLDHNDTMALARNTSLLYRRIAKIACEKCAVEIKKFLGFGTPWFEHLRYKAKILGCIAAFDMFTPMVIKCFETMKMWKWDRRLRLLRNKKPQDADYIRERLATMLAYIVRHGSLDAFKTFNAENEARLDIVYDEKIRKRKKQLEDFKDYMYNEGYILYMEIEYRRSSRKGITLLSRFESTMKNAYSPKEANMRDTIRAFQTFDFCYLRSQDPDRLGNRLVRHGLASFVR